MIDCYDKIISTYYAMVSRCCHATNVEYRLYGARGITVCDEWMANKENFVRWSYEHGVDEHLCIDRIDPDGNYCPANCRWVTVDESARNRRNVRRFEWRGEFLTLMQISEKTGIPVGRFFTYARNTSIERLRALILDMSYGMIGGLPDSRKRYITVNHETLSISEWERRLGLDRFHYLLKRSAQKSDAEMAKLIKNIMNGTHRIKNFYKRVRFMVHEYLVTLSDLTYFGFPALSPKYVEKLLLTKGHQFAEEYLNSCTTPILIEGLLCQEAC
jgi:predicted DNA-binding ribbon-helix-helix protein